MEFRASREKVSKIIVAVFGPLSLTHHLFIIINSFANIKMSLQSSGLAFIGTLCEADESLSIVEEQGGFQSIGTAAHEIGHR